MAPRTLVEKNKKKLPELRRGKRMGTRAIESSNGCRVPSRRSTGFSTAFTHADGPFRLYSVLNSGAYRTSRERSESRSVQISQIVSDGPDEVFFVLL